MKARVLKTQMLIFFLFVFNNIKTDVRFRKVENSHGKKHNMLRLPENMVAVPSEFENTALRRSPASDNPMQSV